MTKEQEPAKEKQMKIDDKRIEFLAELAKIDMGTEEMEAQRYDLERIATYTECLNGLDTTDMPEQSHPFGPSGLDGRGGMARLREDEVTNKDQTAEWMRAAPDSKGRYFRVPRTIEE